MGHIRSEAILIICMHRHLRHLKIFCFGIKNIFMAWKPLHSFFKIDITVCIFLIVHYPESKVYDIQFFCTVKLKSGG